MPLELCQQYAKDGKPFLIKTDLFCLLWINSILQNYYNINIFNSVIIITLKLFKY